MPEKLKILQVNKLYHPWIGGVETHVKDLSEKLVCQPHINLNVLVCNDKYQNVEETINGVKVTKLANIVCLLFKKVLLFSMPISLAFANNLKKFKADIIHIHLPNPLAVVSYLWSRPKGKLVLMWHSDIIKQKTIMFFYKPILNIILKKADVILTTSPNMVKNSLFLQEYKNKTVVVPLGINPDLYEFPKDKSESLRSEREKYGDKIVLYVGRFTYYKGVKYLLDAVKDIDGHLIMIGDGYLLPEIEEQIKKEKISSKVTILPPLEFEKLVYYYHLCDVFVLPSIARSEAFGIVQLESMICGKPVVSTDLPTGVPFVNEHNKTGFVVSPKSSDELAKAINTLLSDKELRDKMGDYAEQRVRKTFTNDMLMQRILKIYDDLSRK